MDPEDLAIYSSILSSTLRYYRRPCTPHGHARQHARQTYPRNHQRRRAQEVDEHDHQYRGPPLSDAEPPLKVNAYALEVRRYGDGQREASRTNDVKHHVEARVYSQKGRFVRQRRSSRLAYIRNWVKLMIV